MANPKSEEILNSVQSSYAELTALVNGELSELDSALLYRRPDPNEWTIMEILAHLVELMPYWGNEVEKLLANPGQNSGPSGGAYAILGQRGREITGKSRPKLWAHSRR